MESKSSMTTVLLGSLVVAVALITLCPTHVHATAIGLCDLDSPGTCTSSVTLSGTTLTLTNTSPAANGGFLTASAFDLIGNVKIIAFATTDTHFNLFLPSAGSAFNVQPFGQREFLISAQRDTFEGGRRPRGLAPGQTVTFTLTLNNAVGINESTVLASEAVRFRGFADGSSDKDQITVQAPEPNLNILMLMSLSFVGLLHFAWRRKHMGRLPRDFSWPA